MTDPVQVLVATGLVAGFADLSRPANEQTHVGRFFQKVGEDGPSGFFTVIGRKLGLMLGTFSNTAWVLLVLSVLVVTVLAFRRTDLMTRLFARVPADVVRVSAATLAQLVHRRARRGVLRAIPFRHGTVEGQRDIGRRALAQALGSLGPNTIVIGIDRERDLLLVHQLRRSGDADSIDLLRVR